MNIHDDPLGPWGAHLSRLHLRQAHGVLEPRVLPETPRGSIVWTGVRRACGGFLRAQGRRTLDSPAASAPVAEPLEEGEPFSAIREHVTRLAGTATGDRWAIVKEEDPAGELTFHMVNLALMRVDHVLMEQRLAVTLPLKAPTVQGLVTDTEAERLNQLEDALLAALGHDALQIGRQTGHGKRTIHLHVAAVGPAEKRAREWAKGVGEYAVEIESRPDPGWEILRRF